MPSGSGIQGQPSHRTPVKENTDDLVIDFLNNELRIDIDPSEICRSHRVGKKPLGKPRPIVVRLVRHNLKKLTS